MNDFWKATTGTEASIWLSCENRPLTLNSSQAKSFCGTNLRLWELLDQLSGYTVLRFCVHSGYTAVGIQVLVMLVFLGHPVALWSILRKNISNVTPKHKLSMLPDKFIVVLGKLVCKYWKASKLFLDDRMADKMI